jgi:hypothetical protein
MQGIADYLTSPKGEAAINATASVIFVVLILVSILTQRIFLGSIPPKIGRAENPRIFWAVLSLYAIIVTWTATEAVRGLF